ncbi:protein broad-minded-like [Macrosteles quadrilineatus]|uniref:protein broad-minded-like n=1 Tax=Macrosteles quadrilineatus TaxID=74068 RepID=UPI0023E2BB0F|nr:protein broad-minded-like [Macrosteles quadrilineatus]
MKQRREIEHQGSLGDAENNFNHPFEVYLKYLLEKTKPNHLKEEPRMIVIMSNMFKNFDQMLGIDYALRTQIIELVGEVFTNLIAGLKTPQSNVDLDEINVLHTCAEFLLHCGITPLGFNILQKLGLVSHILHEELQRPDPNWSNYVWLGFITKASASEEGFSVLTSQASGILKMELLNLWSTIDEDCSGSELPVRECSNSLLRAITLFTLNLKGVRAFLKEPEDGSEATLTEESDTRPLNLFSLIRDFALNYSKCPDFIHHLFALTVLDILVSNIDSSIYLMNKFNFQESLLIMQAESRVDESSEVIIDECSLLRQKIIEKTILPVKVNTNLKPSHTFPRPDSTLTRTKPRSRGNGEFARWLSETRPGLHDHNWLKHARKLYRNSSPDDVKGTTIIDLLEQVSKVLPEVKPAIKWQRVDDRFTLRAEEQLAIQLAVKYGAHHRIFQETQANIENLSQLVLIVNTSLKATSDCFDGFDWFVASSFLLCSGNIEKAQAFLSLMSTLPTAPLLWSHFGEASLLAQLGNVLDCIVSEEMPALFYVLQRNGLSWWQLCRGWIAQCWWGVLDWPYICHWLMTGMLYQSDHLLYFCAALLHSNHDRLMQMSIQGTVYEIVTNPAERFQLAEARIMIDKLHKKYHGTLHSYISSL